MFHVHFVALIINFFADNIFIVVFQFQMSSVTLLCYQQKYACSKPYVVQFDPNCNAYCIERGKFILLISVNSQSSSQDENRAGQQDV
jgi:hypothetical protein